jgi:hypothetical protein
MRPITQTASAPRVLRALGWAVGCGVFIFSFWDARELNSGYVLPTQGVSSVPASEQVFYLWFAICGSLATVCLAQCLTQLGLAPRLSKFLDTACARPGAWIACIALFVFAASVLFRRFILLDQPVTDDESTYRFIARTLLTGRVTNPLPDDAEFFKNQFIVMNAHGWHGKYPIGRCSRSRLTSSGRARHCSRSRRCASRCCSECCWFSMTRIDLGIEPCCWLGSCLASAFWCGRCLELCSRS